MKVHYFKTIILLIAAHILFLMVSCSTVDDAQDISDYLAFLSGSDCPETGCRQEMRDFVQGISTWARTIDADFIVIPQNGIELITDDGESTGTPVNDYINAISGVGQEDLFYGYNNDDQATPSVATDYLTGFLDVAVAQGIQVMVTDYCSTPSKMDDSYTKNETKGYISFAADERDLNNIPGYPVTIHNESTSDITGLNDAQNFLYIINPENYMTKSDFITAIQGTNYDIVLMDLFFNDGSEFTSTEITSLKVKDNGGSRLVVSYMSIGEAENYRYYWQSGWKPGNPEWLDRTNPNWPGNYKVKYWYTEWQDIIYGNDTSYLKKILDAGFDGVYLDIIDAFEYFE